jgi:hypothetical protein
MRGPDTEKPLAKPPRAPKANDDNQTPRELAA